MSAERLRSVTVETEPGFPAPLRDRLGLATDPIHLSSRITPKGQEFVLVHSRPFSGAQMHMFLNSVAPYTDYRANNRRIYDRLVNPTPNRVREKPRRGEPEEDFEDMLQRVHRATDETGTGLAFSQFVAKVGREWTEALDDPNLDSVFVPLAALWCFRDLSATAHMQIEKWKELMPNKPERWGAEAVHNVLTHTSPNEQLEALREEYGRSRHEAWQNREEDPDGTEKAYERFGQNLSLYLDGLSEDERVNLVGKAYSELPGARRGHANHTLARRLIVDLKGRQHWIEMPYVYDLKVGRTDKLVFPEPILDIDDATIGISDKKGTSVKLEFADTGDDFEPQPWSIREYTLPESSYVNGRYPAIAWRVDRDGNKSFLSHSETATAVLEAGIPIRGIADSYLGKLLVRYFRQRGEQVESEADGKWLTRMGLPDSDSTRPITDRELPVWIQLPQHQPDLLSSQFIQAAEQLVA